ncbi:MAG: type III secretion inner membrane ring lipoprotein SctJ [Pseudomonadota bacterium]
MRTLIGWLRPALAVGLLLMLGGCKVELFSEIPEAEANEMVALLLSEGIDAEKGAIDKGLVTLNVESADLSAAIEILNQNGFPRDSFSDLGAMFGEQGLISSPLEERVRFVFGLSQAISETLTQIDGVVTARVHLVMPERHPLDEVPTKSTASVFIKTRPGLVIDDKIPQVKMLVQNSVEGLAFEDVSVAVFEANPPETQRNPAPPMADIFGFRYPADQEGKLILWGGLAGLVMLILLVLNIFLVIYLFGRGKRRTDVAVTNG